MIGIEKELSEFCIFNRELLKEFDNKTILVTGATGLIGSTLVKVLCAANRMFDFKIRILMIVRNKEKASRLFSRELLLGMQIQMIVGDVIDKLSINETVNYIVHGASQTASEMFMKEPVETIKTTVIGTENLLQFACDNRIESMVYMSSMEVYGSPKTNEMLSEKDVGYIDPLSLRSCYPESKRLSETLCHSYACEYNVPVKIVRLAQTFGPGVSYDDKRVFAEFARNAMEGKDITILTDGKSTRMYLYTLDAISGLIYILLKGENGLGYNVANKETYCSIKEMAEMVADILAVGEISIHVADSDEAAKKYPPAHHLCLDVSRLEQLGWQPTVNLTEMYRRMADSMMKTTTMFKEVTNECES